MIRIRPLALAFAALLGAGAAAAQTYPDKPISFVVPLPQAARPTRSRVRSAMA